MVHRGVGRSRVGSLRVKHLTSLDEGASFGLSVYTSRRVKYSWVVKCHQSCEAVPSPLVQQPVFCSIWAMLSGTAPGDPGWWVSLWGFWGVLSPVCAV